MEPWILSIVGVGLAVVFFGRGMARRLRALPTNPIDDEGRCVHDWTPGRLANGAECQVCDWCGEKKLK